MAVEFLNLQKLHAEIAPEIDAAIAAVRAHGQFINGPEVKAFEKDFAAYCTAKHAIGCANGTAALHVILQCAGLGPGDEVIIPSHTFVATAESICLTGATPVLADVDTATWLLSPEEVHRQITAKTRAIVAVHLYGMPADKDAFRAKIGGRGILLIEDAAQAHGATLNGKRVGTLADAAAFSFFPGKNLGAFGDAGGITTNDDALAEKMRLYINHGRVGKYEHLTMGTNYRLDTIQAAILQVKLRHLDRWNAQRRKVAAWYRECLRQEPFASHPVAIQHDTPGADSCWHLFVITVEHRDKIAEHLKKRGIGTGVHYPIPVHMQPSMSQYGMGEWSLPVSEGLGKKVLSLPMCPTMVENDVDEVCEALKQGMGYRV
ncbi:DegT/DnrJ/EryC1/StrS family aminotransferase [soil metagenome]